MRSWAMLSPAVPRTAVHVKLGQCADHPELGPAVPCCAVLLCRAVPCYAMLCRAQLTWTVWELVELGPAVPCRAMPCCAVLCHAMLCTMQPGRCGSLWSCAVAS